MDDAVKTKIDYEISQIDELIEKSKILITLCKSKEPDFIEITAIGGILHSFYNGLENIFVLIGKTLGFDFKSSPQWHRNLVDFIFSQPDFLPSDLRSLLTEYMGFRHFFPPHLRLYNKMGKMLSFVSWAFRFLAENKKLNRKILSTVILFDTFVCHTNSHIALALVSINFHTETARRDVFVHAWFPLGSRKTRGATRIRENKKPLINSEYVIIFVIDI